MSKARRARKENTPLTTDTEGPLCSAERGAEGSKRGNIKRAGSPKEKHPCPPAPSQLLLGQQLLPPAGTRVQGWWLSCRTRGRENRSRYRRYHQCFSNVFITGTFLSLFFFIITWGQNIAETGHIRAVQQSYTEQ